MQGNGPVRNLVERPRDETIEVGDGAIVIGMNDIREDRPDSQRQLMWERAKKYLKEIQNIYAQHGIVAALQFVLAGAFLQPFVSPERYQQIEENIRQNLEEARSNPDSQVKILWKTLYILTAGIVVVLIGWKVATVAAVVATFGFAFLYAKLFLKEQFDKFIDKLSEGLRSIANSFRSLFPS